MNGILQQSIAVENGIILRALFGQLSEETLIGMLEEIFSNLTLIHGVYTATTSFKGTEAHYLLSMLKLHIK